MRGVAGIPHTPLVPGDGWAGSRGALVLAMLLELLLGPHLSRNGPKAHRVQGDVHQQMVMLYLDIEIIKRNVSWITCRLQRASRTPVGCAGLTLSSHSLHRGKENFSDRELFLCPWCAETIFNKLLEGYKQHCILCWERQLWGPGTIQEINVENPKPESRRRQKKFHSPARLAPGVRHGESIASQPDSFFWVHAKTPLSSAHKLPTRNHLQMHL